VPLVSSECCIHFLQNWFNLADPAAEEALYDSRALRRLVGIDPGREPIPDGTTICKFGYLREKHTLRNQPFHLMNQYLKENGMQLAQGTIVDARMLMPRSSTHHIPLHHPRRSEAEIRDLKPGITSDSEQRLIASDRAGPS
jgi:IS5 family transposase